MSLIRLHNFDRRDYLHQKRILMIQKAHIPLQIRLQRIMNQAIDERILFLSGEVDEENQTGYNTPSYKEEILLQMIGRENRIATRQDITRLLDRSIVNQNHITNLEKLIASRSISDKITKVEVEQVNKNLRYVEKTLEEAEIDINKYKSLITKLPKQVSRRELLEKALIKGENYKGRQYSYRELRQLSLNLERYKTGNLDYQVALIENRQADREGVPNPNTMKTWIWSSLEKTRHHRMDGQTVRFSEKFEVVNENTGDTDFLRFPGDIENDHNNCSNICNCACSYEIY